MPKAKERVFEVMEFESAFEAETSTQVEHRANSNWG
jgi:hypothetical protein